MPSLSQMKENGLNYDSRGLKKNKKDDSDCELWAVLYISEIGRNSGHRPTGLLDGTCGSWQVDFKSPDSWLSALSEMPLSFSEPKFPDL